MQAKRVVSHIEVRSHAHGSYDLLGIQIDATINHGNSVALLLSSRKQSPQRYQMTHPPHRHHPCTPASVRRRVYNASFTKRNDGKHQGSIQIRSEQWLETPSSTPTPR